MKIILYTLVCAAVALGACNNSDATEAEMELARATGRADAMKAVVEDLAPCLANAPYSPFEAAKRCSVTPDLPPARTYTSPKLKKCFATAWS